MWIGEAYIEEMQTLQRCWEQLLQHWNHEIAQLRKIIAKVNDGSEHEGKKGTPRGILREEIDDSLLK